MYLFKKQKKTELLIILYFQFFSSEFNHHFDCDDIKSLHKI